MKYISTIDLITNKINLSFLMIYPPLEIDIEQSKKNMLDRILKFLKQIKNY